MSTLNAQDQIKKYSKSIAFIILPIVLFFVLVWSYLRVFFCWGSGADSSFGFIICSFSPLTFITGLIFALFMAYLVIKKIRDTGSDQLPPLEEIDSELLKHPRISGYINSVETFSQKHPKFIKPGKWITRNSRNAFRNTKSVYVGYRSLDQSSKRHTNWTAILLFVVSLVIIWLLFWGQMNFI